MTGVVISPFNIVPFNRGTDLVKIQDRTVRQPGSFKPPPTNSSLPLTSLLSSEVRDSAAAATSEGSARHPSGVVASTARIISRLKHRQVKDHAILLSIPL